MTEKNFNTAEKFLLLAHHPEKGRFLIQHIYLQYGIAGAILLDMTLEDRIEMADKRFILKRAEVSADPVISDVASLMSQSSKPRKVDYWIRKLGNRHGKYKWQILKGLADRRIVRIEEKKFLGFIPYRKSYLIESYTRSKLIQQLRNEILSYRGSSFDNAALAGLVKACRMQRILSADRDDLKQIRENLKKMLSDSPVSDIVSQTIRQVHAAIITSVTAAIVASSAGGRH